MLDLQPIIDYTTDYRHNVPGLAKQFLMDLLDEVSRLRARGAEGVPPGSGAPSEDAQVEEAWNRPQVEAARIKVEEAMAAMVGKPFLPVADFTKVWDCLVMVKSFLGEGSTPTPTAEAPKCWACGESIQGEVMANDDGPAIGLNGQEFNITMHPECWQDMDGAIARRKAREAAAPSGEGRP